MFLVYLLIQVMTYKLHYILFPDHLIIFHTPRDTLPAHKWAACRSVTGAGNLPKRRTPPPDHDLMRSRVFVARAPPTVAPIFAFPWCRTGLFFRTYFLGFVCRFFLFGIVLLLVLFFFVGCVIIRSCLRVFGMFPRCFSCGFLSGFTVFGLLLWLFGRFCDFLNFRVSNWPFSLTSTHSCSGYRQFISI